MKLFVEFREQGMINRQWHVVQQDAQGGTKILTSHKTEEEANRSLRDAELVLSKGMSLDPFLKPPASGV
jgi:hypothetical protein